MKERNVERLTALSLREALEALEKELDTDVTLVYIGYSFNDQNGYISNHWDVERAHFVLPGEAWVETDDGEFVLIKER